MKPNPIVVRILAAVGVSLTAPACFTTGGSCPEPTEKTVEPIEGCTLTITNDDQIEQECLVVDLEGGDCPTAESVNEANLSLNPAVCGPLGPPELTASGSGGNTGSGGSTSSGGNTGTGGSGGTAGSGGEGGVAGMGGSGGTAGSGGGVAGMGGSGGEGGGAIAQGLCCYPTLIEYQCIGGRPFLVEGVPRVAQRRTAVASVHPTSGAALSPALRERIGREWVRDGLTEHASVASFARFALELMAVGAPLALLRDAQAALADEISHAEICFSMATAYGLAEEPLGPLDFGVVRADAGLAAIVVGTIREGCVGETTAALIAQRAAESATDHAARAALSRIADDEARHAELAWRFVMWAIAQSAEIHAIATATLEESTAQISIEAAELGPSDLDEPELLAHGRLPSKQRKMVMRAAVKDVLLPCLASLQQTERRG